MPKHPTSILALFVSFGILSAAPAIGADGQVTITQAKANAGNVTPGDAPGFPVKLTQPGSYIFASNLQPPAGKGGINIASNDVTIDMNGFRMNGAGVATTGIYGADFDSATIRNGTITSFEAHGISTTGDNWTVESMRVVENGAYGVYLNGFNAAVRGSTAAENGDAGIRCYKNCLVEDSIASGNGTVGILVGEYVGTILGNVIIGNVGYGMIGGFEAGFGSNTLAFNNSGGAQVLGGTALHPNACDPACP